MFSANGAKSRLKEALRLLEAERRLLLKGDIKGLARFQPKREVLVQRLAALTGIELAANEGVVIAVRTAARRNAALLDAFLAGARSALNRLEEAASKDALGAYRKDGTRIEPVAHTGSMLRRL